MTLKLVIIKIFRAIRFYLQIYLIFFYNKRFLAFAAMQNMLSKIKTKKGNKAKIHSEDY